MSQSKLLKTKNDRKSVGATRAKDTTLNLQSPAKLDNSGTKTGTQYSHLTHNGTKRDLMTSVQSSKYSSFIGLEPSAKSVRELEPLQS